MPRPVPGPGEIEIEVRATGLNFKDVLKALGKYPLTESPLGDEFAGVVAAIGPGVDRLRPWRSRRSPWRTARSGPMS